MKTDEVALMLGMSVTTVRRMVKTGTLKLEKQSQYFDITKESVEAVLLRKKIAPPVWKRGNNCV